MSSEKSGQGVVTINDLDDLKKAYENCTDDSFEFKGSEIIKAYAKYLIEYLEGAKEGIREMNALGGRYEK